MKDSVQIQHLFTGFEAQPGAVGAGAGGGEKGLRRDHQQPHRGGQAERTGQINVLPGVYIVHYSPPPLPGEGMISNHLGRFSKGVEVEGKR